MRKIFTTFLTLSAMTLPAAQGHALESSGRRVPADVVMRSPEIQSGNLADLPLITDTPEGDLLTYSKNAIYFGLDFYGQMYSSADYGRIAEVVEAPGGKVFFKNPFCGIDTGSWLEGEADGDRITVTFPQKIYSETYPDWEQDPEGNVMKTDNFYAFKLLFSTDGETSKMELDLSNPTITFTRTDNGIVMDGDAFIGLLMENVTPDATSGETVSSVTWTRYADSAISFRKVTDAPISIPQGVDTEKWVMSSDGMVCFVNVGIDNDDIYIAGLLSSMPEGVVKGKITDGKVVFDGPQYMGEATRLGHFAYFIPADVSVNEDPEIFEPYIFNATGSISFDYDSAERVISTSDEIGIATSSIPQSVFLLEGYYAPEFRWQDFSTPMTPDNPEIIDYDYFDDFGYGAITYNIPNWSTDGRVMETSNLFYNFFIDDKIFVLYPDEYPDFTEPVENIPAEYEDSNIYYWGDFYEAIIYPTGFDRIGVRSFYINADGSKTYSDIVYNDGSVTSSISSASGSMREVTSVEYISPDGRHLPSPVNGSVCIRLTRFSDGSFSTSKIMTK